MPNKTTLYSMNFRTYEIHRVHDLTAFAKLGSLMSNT